MSVRQMVAPLQPAAHRKEPAMIEFARTASGVYFRCQLTPETMVLILTLARLVQQLLEPS